MNFKAFFVMVLFTATIKVNDGLSIEEPAKRGRQFALFNIGEILM